MTTTQSISELASRRFPEMDQTGESRIIAGPGTGHTHGTLRIPITTRLLRPMEQKSMLTTPTRDILFLDMNRRTRGEGGWEGFGEGDQIESCPPPRGVLLLDCLPDIAAVGRRIERTCGTTLRAVAR